MYVPSLFLSITSFVIFQTRTEDYPHDTTKNYFPPVRYMLLALQPINFYEEQENKKDGYVHTLFFSSSILSPFFRVIFMI